MTKALSITMAILVSPLCVPVLAAQQPTKSQAAVATEEPTKRTLVITGILLKKDGTPAKATVVIAYPLDGAGKAISVNTPDKDGRMVLWNPKAESDANGRFTVRVPHVSAIGKDTIRSVALGLNEPPGGMVTATVSKITYADPGMREEYGFVRKGENVNLLRQRGDVRKVTFEQSPETDLGKIVLE